MYGKSTEFLAAKEYICTLKLSVDKQMSEKELDFTKMISDNKGSILAVCYMFSKDNDEVSDLYQDILIKLWKGFDSFRGESSPRTWIYRIALNACISEDRSRKRHGEKVPLDIDIDLYDDHEERTGAAEQTRQLYRRISQLGLVDRSIILLWLEAMSYDEIGQIIGISPKNVSVKLVRIKEQLKKIK